MKKQLSIFMIAGILLILTGSFTSAYHAYEQESIQKNYITNVDTWKYREDIYGKNRGFTLDHYYTSPKYNYYYESLPQYNQNSQNNEQRFSSTTHTSFTSERSFTSNRYNSAYDSSYNSQTSVKEAFQTYQQNSQRTFRYGYSYSNPYYPDRRPYYYGGYW